MAEDSYAHHFSLANIPFGIASSSSHPDPVPVTRLSNDVIFLDILYDAGLFHNIPDLSSSTFKQAALNDFASLGRAASRAVRATIQRAFAPTSNYTPPPGAVIPLTQAQLHLPVRVGDFTDFSCSRDHVVTAGEAVFGKRILPEGFRHFPLGYGGRSSSIVTSGTPVQRPLGQYRSKTEPGVVEFGPCQDLDYELELGCIIGKPVQMGAIATAADADEHIFGVVLLDDWSARDILALEIVPLGPLNAKNFATSISPWVVTLDALDPFAVPSPPREGPVAPYLHDPAPNGTYAVELRAEVIVDGVSTRICTAKLEWMYWSFRAIFAHQCIGGCGVSSGDIVATGTASGSAPGSQGCLLEMTMGGKKAFQLQGGGGGGNKERKYLEDGDAVRITGFAGSEEDGVGFGECVGMVVPAAALKGRKGGGEVKVKVNRFR